MPKAFHWKVSIPGLMKRFLVLACLVSFKFHNFIEIQRLLLLPTLTFLCSELKLQKIVTYKSYNRGVFQRYHSSSCSFTNTPVFIGCLPCASSEPGAKSRTVNRHYGFYEVYSTYISPICWRFLSRNWTKASMCLFSVCFFLDSII